MAARRSLDLERLKAFAKSVSEHMLACADAAAIPSDLQSELTQAIGRANSVRGVEMIVNDMLEWSQDVHGNALESLDRELARQGFPTLSLMRSRADRSFAKVLARGSIQTEEEYRLVDARLSDTSSSLSLSDRELGGTLLAAFRR